VECDQRIWPAAKYGLHLRELAGLAEMREAFAAQAQLDFSSVHPAIFAGPTADTAFMVTTSSCRSRINGKERAGAVDVYQMHVTGGKIKRVRVWVQDSPGLDAMFAPAA